jgi:hypothetical protein
MKKFVNILIIFILLVPGTLPAETSSEINLSRIFAEKKATHRETKRFFLAAI